MSVPYCTIEDVALKLDDRPSEIRPDRRSRLLSRAEAASDKWDAETGTPFRTVRVGSPQAKQTWEQHDAREAGNSLPIRVSLQNRHINPINPDKGDAIEVRTGRDDYEDITDEQGDEWVLDNDRGNLRLFRFLYQRLYWEHPSERFLRITYRHGGLGGDQNRGAESRLSSSVDDTATALDVENADRFPARQFRAIVGNAPDLESVRVTDVDYSTDTLTVERGVRYTDPIQHDAGVTVNYAPDHVREAVAAKAAELLTMTDSAEQSLPDDGQLTSRDSRAEKLKMEYQQAASKHSNVRTL